MRKVFKSIIRVYRLVLFIFYYLKELTLSCLYVAYDILTPMDLMKPGIVEVPVDLKNEIAILAYTNLITMTPGSLTMDMSPDKKKIYVHAMYLHDKEDFIRKMKGELEKKISEIFE
uniref:Na+/H+ antiporter subunit E n=1 Tax=Candidatus Electrothrix sp. TaxID=2170559 RepID=UPI00405627A0